MSTLGRHGLRGPVPPAPARTDPMEQWVNAAPEGGRTPLEETIREYLGSHNPFPDEIAVEVLRGDGSTWDHVIAERVGVDEWTVEYGEGKQAWRDHHELRPPASASSWSKDQLWINPWVVQQRNYVMVTPISVSVTTARPNGLSPT